MSQTHDITDDAFLGGKLNLLQPKSGYRAGVDAVLLGASVPASADAPVSLLDVGAGVGTASLCALARCLAARAVLLEREAPLAELAQHNVTRNGLQERCTVIQGDLEVLTNDMLSAAGAPPNSFDHVIANPPFHVEGSGTAAGSGLKARSHAMPGVSLEAWCRFLARMAKPSGTVTIIHKVDALAELLHGLGSRFGGLKVLPVQPRDGAPAIRVLVRGIKGSRAPLELLPAAILHEEGHAFTRGAEDVLRLGAPLDLDYWTGFRRDL